MTAEAQMILILIYIFSNSSDPPTPILFCHGHRIVTSKTENEPIKLKFSLKCRKMSKVELKSSPYGRALANLSFLIFPPSHVLVFCMFNGPSY